MGIERVGDLFARTRGRSSRSLPRTVPPHRLVTLRSVAADRVGRQLSGRQTASWRSPGETRTPAPDYPRCSGPAHLQTELGSLFRVRADARRAVGRAWGGVFRLRGVLTTVARRTAWPGDRTA